MILFSFQIVINKKLLFKVGNILLFFTSDLMKNTKQLFFYNILISLVLFINCTKDSDDPDPDNTIDPIIGSWILTNEEWTGTAENPYSIRSCYLQSDHGKPNKWNITETKATQKIWKCWISGPGAGKMPFGNWPIIYDETWTNLGNEKYEFDGERGKYIPYSISYSSDLSTMIVIWFEGEYAETWTRR